MDNQKVNKKRMTRFALVGVFNTAFDFGILNTLVFVFGLTSIVANIISGSIATIVSFFLNQNYVFKNDGQKTWHKFILFIVITTAGLYGLQNLIIFILTNYVTGPAELVFDLLDLLAAGTFSREFVQLNFAKTVATLASLCWNYFLYAKFVFKKHSDSA